MGHREMLNPAEIQTILKLSKEYHSVTKITKAEVVK